MGGACLRQVWASPLCRRALARLVHRFVHTSGSWSPLSLGVRAPPRWCREDPAACRVGSEGLKQRGRQPIRRGLRGGSPAWQLRALQIHRNGHAVQDCPLPVMCWADVPGLSARDRPCPAAWQQYWQQTAEATQEPNRISSSGRRRSGSVQARPMPAISPPSTVPHGGELRPKLQPCAVALVCGSRTLQGMARVRVRAGLAWPLVADRRGLRGSDAQGWVPKIISAQRS